MFRISKSDDDIERSRLEDETTGGAPSPGASGGAVTASALRWLRGPKKLEERNDDSDGRSGMAEEADLPETSDLQETGDPEDHLELELAEPLVLDALEEDGEDSGSESPDAPGPATTDVVRVDMATSSFETPFDPYDIDDDVGDFDDLSPIDSVVQLEPVAKVLSLPSIDLDDIASPDDLDSSLPLSIDLATVDAEPGDHGETMPALDERSADEAAEIDEPADLLLIELESIEPPYDRLQDPPVADAPPETQPRSDGLEEDALAEKLDETPVGALDTSLALQPIPELQSAPRAPIKASPEPKRLDDAPSASFDDAVGDNAVDADLAGRSEEPLFDHDVRLDAELLTTDALEVDAPGIEGLKIEPLDLAGPDETDDQIGNDWHAHLADVLGGESDLAGEDHPELEIAGKISLKPETDTQPAERSDDAPVALPLSKTLAQLATASDSNAGDDFLVSPLLARKPRQKTAAGQPPSALPADTTDLSPEQLSLGIIANVPRLRRFAAVQIGDELLADQLVQTTIETVLGDPSALQPASDLGLALITLLYQRRQEMLDDPAAAQRSPDAAHAFETALCRGLAGADQFEIHQFARAINRLDERERELLVLVALESLTYDQIADMIQIPTERVMTKVANARISLRQALANDESEQRAASSITDTQHAQEIEIHGYLDGELDGRHMADVDALIEHDQDAADRLLHYGIQGDLIRRLYAPLLNRPIPGQMLGALSAATKPARWGFRFGTRRALIAGAFMLALGASAALSYVSPALSGVISDAMTISLATIQR